MSDAYEGLGIEISHYSALGNVLIGEDFNSRLGCKHKDFLVSDSNDFLPVDQTFLLDSENFRNTKDKAYNTLGKYLSELCLTHNLKLLNGRTTGDLTGKCPCYKYNGNSIVDYITTLTAKAGKLVGKESR